MRSIYRQGEDNFIGSALVIIRIEQAAVIVFQRISLSDCLLAGTDTFGIFVSIGVHFRIQIEFSQ